MFVKTLLFTAVFVAVFGIPLNIRGNHPDSWETLPEEPPLPEGQVWIVVAKSFLYKYQLAVWLATTLLATVFVLSPSRKKAKTETVETQKTIKAAVDRYLEDMKKGLKEMGSQEARDTLQFLDEHFSEIQQAYYDNRIKVKDIITGNRVTTSDGSRLRYGPEIAEWEIDILKRFKYFEPMRLVIADLCTMERALSLAEQWIECHPFQVLNWDIMSDAGHAKAEKDDQIALVRFFKGIRHLKKNLCIRIILTSTSEDIDDVKKEVRNFSQNSITSEEIEEAKWIKVPDLTSDGGKHRMLLRIAPIKQKDWDAMGHVLSSPEYKRSFADGIAIHMDNAGSIQYPDLKHINARFPTQAPSANKSCDHFNEWFNGLQFPNLSIVEVTTLETWEGAFTLKYLEAVYGEDAVREQWNAVCSRILGVMHTHNNDGTLFCMLPHGPRTIAKISNKSLGMSSEYTNLFYKAWKAGK